jgi:APA family basic amino acid/polyamine antiporter
VDSIPPGGEFRRVLGVGDLIVLALGAIVGAGIFVVSGTAAAQFAGPAITLSFVVAGLGCLAVGLCFAELSSMMPEVGGVYRYSRAAFGETIGWLMGWVLIAEFLFGAATIAVSWSADLVAFLGQLGWTIPPALAQSAFAAEYGSKVSRIAGGGINLPAVLLIAALTAITARGIRFTANVNAVLVVIKLAVLVAVIAFGFSYISSRNWQPFVPPNAGSFGRFGASGVARGAAAVFFAFIGFDVLASVSQEAREPRRAVPIGILGSLVVCVVLYALMGAVVTGLMPYRELNVPHPLLSVITAPGSSLEWLALPIRIAIVVGLASVALVLLLAQPRLLYAMAVDGLGPRSFTRMDQLRGVPSSTTIASGVIAAVLAGVAPLGLLLEMVAAGTLLSFVVVCLAVLVLRHREPNVRRPFRIPLGPVVPVLGVAFSVGVMATIQFDTWIRVVLWLLLGLAIYFVYARSAAGRERDFR